MEVSVRDERFPPFKSRIFVTFKAGGKYCPNTYNPTCIKKPYPIIGIDETCKIKSRFLLNVLKLLHFKPYLAIYPGIGSGKLDNK